MYKRLIIACIVMTSLAGCSKDVSQSAYDKGVAEAESKWSAEVIEVNTDSADKLAANVAKNRKEYEKKVAETKVESSENYDEASNVNKITYVFNISTGQFHNPSCDILKDYAQTSLKNYYSDRQGAISEGYQPCVVCKP